MTTLCVCSIHGGVSIIFESFPTQIQTETRDNVHTWGAPENGVSIQEQVLAEVVQICGYCLGAEGAIPYTRLDSVWGYMNTTVNSINDAAGNTIIKLPAPRTSNLTFSDVRLMLDAVSCQLSSLRFVNTSSLLLSQGVGSQVGVSFDIDSLKLVLVGISLLENVLGFIQCETLAQPLRDMQSSFAAVLVTLWQGVYDLIATSVLLVGAILLSFVGSHVLDRKKKTYYLQESGRWFRLRCAFRAHRTCFHRHQTLLSLALRQRAPNEERAKTFKELWLQEAHNHYWHAPLLTWASVEQRLSLLYSTLLVWLIAFSALILALTVRREKINTGCLCRLQILQGLFKFKAADAILLATYACLVVPLCGLAALVLRRRMFDTRRYVPFCQSLSVGSLPIKRFLQVMLLLMTFGGLVVTCVLFGATSVAIANKLGVLDRTCRQTRQTFFGKLQQGQSVVDLVQVPPGAEQANRGKRRAIGIGRRVGMNVAAAEQECNANDLSVYLLWGTICHLGVIATALAFISGIANTVSSRFEGGALEYALVRARVLTPKTARTSQTLKQQLTRRMRAQREGERSAATQRGREEEEATEEEEEGEGEPVGQRKARQSRDGDHKWSWWRGKTVNHVWIFGFVAVMCPLVYFAVVTVVTPSMRPLVGAIAAEKMACNGAAHLCWRAYHQVSYATVHNAMSSLESEFALPNNFRSYLQALEAGVRALMLDVHTVKMPNSVNEGGRAALCHGDCALGQLDLTETLGNICRFLIGNPHEVITLIFEEAPLPLDQGDLLLKTQVWQALNVSGCMQLLYSPETWSAAANNASSWPTLGEMIAGGQRLVLFSDRRHEASEIQRPWDLYMWDYMTETPFAFFDREEIEAATSCEYNRGSPDAELYVLNHFVSNPMANPYFAEQINYDVLRRRAERCSQLQRRRANFVTVDFWSHSSVLATVEALNV